LRRRLAVISPSEEDSRAGATKIGAGWTLTSAVYEAAVENPEHPCVRAAKVLVIDNVIKMFDDVPEFVCQWVKNVANKFHGGSAYTVPESIEDSGMASDAWEQHRKDNDIKVSNCPSKGEYTYPKLREKFIQKEFSDKWPINNHFEEALILNQMMVKRGIYKEVMDVLRRKGDWGQNKKNEIVIRNLNALISKICSYDDAHSMEVLRRVAVAIVPLVIPTSGDEYGPFLWDRARYDLISRLDVPIGEHSVPIRKKMEKQMQLQQKKRKIDVVDEEVAKAADESEAVQADAGTVGTRRKRSSKGVSAR
jgi:hypothetical protein